MASKTTVMMEAAQKALTQVLSVKKGDRLLIVTDDSRLRIANAFQSASKRLEAKARVYVLPKGKRPLKAIPKDLLKVISDIDVAVTVFEGRAEETPFRIALIKKIMTVANRLGHGPGITEDMMLEGPMNVDYSEMLARAKMLMSAFDNASSVHITAPAGTDIKLNISGRKFETDVVINEGRWGNLPSGEIWCAPVETEGDGVIVCDGSIGDFGKVEKPIKIFVKGGAIKDIICRDDELLKRLKKALSVDREAQVVGELGIGLNPGARLTGNLLEDEKAGKTAHIAFGNNEDMPGGQNRSKTHRDFLFNLPTIVVNYAHGKARTIMSDGEVRL